MNQEVPQQIPLEVILAFGLSEGATSIPVGTGLINTTWRVENGGRNIILQCVNRIFDTEVNSRIEQVTRHLAQSGMHTTEIVRTVSDEPYLTINGQNWRCLTYLDGVSHERITTDKQAESAAQVLGAFHAAMKNYQQPLLFPRNKVHNIALHRLSLETALSKHREHARFATILPVATEIINCISELQKIPKFDVEIVHGDPKIANFIFSDSDNALALIDLDTVSRGQLLDELGDALRSWCNPVGEDAVNTSFEIGACAAAMRSYRAVPGVPFGQAQSMYLPAAIERIYLELAARFCTDALNETYFGWDSTNFGSASEHQLVRAQGQLNAAKALKKQYKDLQVLVENIWE